MSCPHLFPLCPSPFITFLTAQSFSPSLILSTVILQKICKDCAEFSQEQMQSQQSEGGQQKQTKHTSLLRIRPDPGWQAGRSPTKPSLPRADQTQEIPAADATGIKAKALNRCRSLSRPDIWSQPDLIRTKAHPAAVLRAFFRSS